MDIFKSTGILNDTCFRYIIVDKVHEMFFRNNIEKTCNKTNYNVISIQQVDILIRADKINPLNGENSYSAISGKTNDRSEQGKTSHIEFGMFFLFIRVNSFSYNCFLQPSRKWREIYAIVSELRGNLHKKRLSVCRVYNIIYKTVFSGPPDPGSDPNSGHLTTGRPLMCKKTGVLRVNCATRTKSDNFQPKNWSIPYQYFMFQYTWWTLRIYYVNSNLIHQQNDLLLSYFQCENLNFFFEYVIIPDAKYSRFIVRFHNFFFIPLKKMGVFWRQW